MDIFVAFLVGAVVGGLFGSMFGFLVGCLAAGSTKLDREASVYAEGFADGRTDR